MGIARKVVALIHQLITDRTVVAVWGNSTKEKAVNRGTPQGGVLSPLLWLIVINDLLNNLDRTGCRTVFCADNVAIVVRGKHLSTISEVMQTYLDTIINWADNCGLAVNSSKTELVLFTRKHRAPDFDTPSIQGTSLSVKKEVRYLGLLIDRKLNWGPTSENAFEKPKLRCIAANKQ